MTGQAWRISIYLAMLLYGEDEVTPVQICDVADRLFPTMVFPAVEADAQIELNGTRRLLAFVREPCLRSKYNPAPPTVYDLLCSAAAWHGGMPSVRKRELATIRGVLRSKGDVRQSFLAEFGAAQRSAPAICADGRGIHHPGIAGRDHAGEGAAGRL